MERFIELYNFDILKFTLVAFTTTCYAKLFLCNVGSEFDSVIQFQVSQYYSQVNNVEVSRCCIEEYDGQR